MLSELKKLKSSWLTIALLIFVVIFFAFPTTFWPGGIGIGKDKSVTTTTVETIKKDKQGNLVKTVEITAYNDGKTVWDWLSVLGVPLTLLVLGAWLQKGQQERAEILSREQQERAETLSKEQQERAEKFSEDQQTIADNNTKEEVLQTYFDRLSVMLIDKNLIALSNKLNSDQINTEDKEILDSSLDVIRGRKLSILRRFKNDSERKGSVMNFLIETDIIGKLKLNLSGANLSRANLSGANLSGANLKKADLEDADLEDADLSGTKLDRADLSGANLDGSDLSGANLSMADLSGADLDRANLSGADLSGADLDRANLSGADLSGADLSGADFSEATLNVALLNGADLSGADLSGAKLFGAFLKDIKWNSETVWPDKSIFSKVHYISEELKKELKL